MADKRMPADTARKMIDEQRRYAQNKAAARMNPDMDIGQEIFLKEMREAEAKGDLPPATVEVDADYGGDTRTEVIRSMKGGETPTQALETYNKAIETEFDKAAVLSDRTNRFLKKIAPPDDSDLDQYSGMLELVANGTVTLGDPDLQKEAFELATAIKKFYRSPTSPEGYIPMMIGGRTGTTEAMADERRPLREAVEQARKNLIKKGEMTPED